WQSWILANVSKSITTTRSVAKPIPLHKVLAAFQPSHRVPAASLGGERNRPLTRPAERGGATRWARRETPAPARRHPPPVHPQPSWTRSSRSVVLMRRPPHADFVTQRRRLRIADKRCLSVRLT